jgi:hypothetical protein
MAGSAAASSGSLGRIPVKTRAELRKKGKYNQKLERVGKLCLEMPLLMSSRSEAAEQKHTGSTWYSYE